MREPLTINLSPHGALVAGFLKQFWSWDRNISSLVWISCRSSAARRSLRYWETCLLRAFCYSYRGPILGFPVSDHLFLAFLCSLQIEWRASSLIYNFFFDFFRPVCSGGGRHFRLGGEQCACVSMHIGRRVWGYATPGKF